MYGNKDPIYLNNINGFSYQVLVKAYEPVASKKIGYLREVDGRGHMADDTDWVYASVFLDYAKAK